MLIRSLYIIQEGIKKRALMARFDLPLTALITLETYVNVDLIAELESWADKKELEVYYSNNFKMLFKL